LCIRKDVFHTVGNVTGTKDLEEIRGEVKIVRDFSVSPRIY